MTTARPAGPARPLVVVPTYDEVASLGDVVGRVLREVPHAEVLVVDDASPDGTGELADRLAAADGRVHVLHRKGKDGLGAAYLAGFAWAAGRGHDAVVEMDADGSHLPEQLPDLLAALASGVDVVLGSRWVAGGRIVNWPWYRVLLSRAGSGYARAVLGLPVRDVTGGFRVYRSDVLAGLVADDVASQGYCFQIDLLRRAVVGGRVVVEVPITFVERETGTSKMSRAIVVEAVRLVSWWGLQRLVRVRGSRRRPRVAPHR
ncbi:polyprenol monophosphomannose synthase [Cellulomonas carbonis]|uniref:polyprenol monophosphomannose synthase n=1 Tax=Cellulomonas carbonis TaxID=1386092 RepID=UPI0005BE4880|nr:polyprenol monophosphomannose synthase [Cellulomonas carbonis]GGC15823.1 dolichol-phosphate mannosyltransferase [Cellulomonas carbonis]